MKSRKQQPPLWRGAGHLPKEMVAKQRKEKVPPFHTLSCWFLFQAQDQMNYRVTEGLKAELPKQESPSKDLALAPEVTAQNCSRISSHIKMTNFPARSNDLDVPCV